eukprot:CAMPEP_0172584042 /NCGR_PEP_ID=MMETSP1068-20121228/3615_1 /TAXON_ID=35684 /ORGANISM="Pseudopedinella elastica, Strain CCMP716" /LENGTH=168 /DNA_ID=CAMNT_0013378071 /DNA_START=66 /DNA_END=568 /DNA_ORIENTATION=+
MYFALFPSQSFLARGHRWYSESGPESYCSLLYDLEEPAPPAKRHRRHPQGEKAKGPRGGVGLPQGFRVGEAVPALDEHEEGLVEKGGQAAEDLGEGGLGPDKGEPGEGAAGHEVEPPQRRPELVQKTRLAVLGRVGDLNDSAQCFGLDRPLRLKSPERPPERRIPQRR